MTNNIKKLQQNFIDHILDKKNIKIAQKISYSKIEALARLNIYRNNIFGGFESVLSSIFTRTKEILGEKQFLEFAAKYRKKYHSKSGNLDEYGEFFPKLLIKHKIKYLAELANLELLLYRSYFSANAVNKFNLEKFKKLDPQYFQNLTFTLHPSCISLTSNFPLYEIYTKRKILNNNKQFLLIERCLGDSKLLKITQDDFLFLSLLKKGKNLGLIHQKLSKEIDIGALIKHFISCRIISDFTVLKH